MKSENQLKPNQDQTMTIYKITNKLNGKAYIGQTTKANPFHRIDKHFRCKSNHNVYYLQSAIRKYGEEHFSVEILETASNIDNLNQLEIHYIEQFKTLAPNGYNLKSGGKQGGVCSETTKQKISLIKKGKPNLALRGRKFSASHRAKLSEVRKSVPKTAKQKAVHKLVIDSLKQPVKAINVSSGKEVFFQSIQDCADYLGLVPSCVSRVLNARQNRKQHKGWKFERIVHEILD
jgi:group I intron endonuclease